ncbi:hypothetical protein HON52_01060 [Candidatus Uhrbacteria bacterium]|nr:hypothetical protein [Candidatus Uhrbacteria bacterium]
MTSLVSEETTYVCPWETEEPQRVSGGLAVPFYDDGDLVACGRVTGLWRENGKVNIGLHGQIGDNKMASMAGTIDFENRTAELTELSCLSPASVKGFINISRRLIGVSPSNMRAYEVRSTPVGFHLTEAILAPRRDNFVTVRLKGVVGQPGYLRVRLAGVFRSGGPFCDGDRWRFVGTVISKGDNHGVRCVGIVKTGQDEPRSCTFKTDRKLR